MDKLKKILSPGHNKDDDVLYGSGENSGSTTRGGGGSHHAGADEQLQSKPAAEKDSGMMRQILNPGDDKYDETRFGTTATAAGGASTGASNTSSSMRGAAGTDYSSGSGLGDTNKSLPHTPATGAGNGLTGQSLPDRSVGSGERSFPLSGGATTGSGAGTAALGGHHEHSHGGERGVRKDLVETYVGTALKHDHKGHGHHYEGDPCPAGTHEGMEGFPHFVPGPHATDTANRLDPHVSEGPTEHATSSTSGATGTSALPGMSGTSGMSGMTGTSGVSGTSSGQHHLGRDAAIGGVGAAAAGGLYERERGQREDVPRTSTSGLSGTTEATRTGHPSSTAGDASSQHHLGRDAGLAGVGAAAAGGAYEMGQARHSGTTGSGPASGTTGPHSSNLANIVDPRVQPQPEMMKDRTTAGPHQSDMMNKADPHVDSDLSKSQSGKDHHYGRDAAAAGGVGALGTGAYEASRKEREPREGASGGLPGNPYSTAPVDPRVDATPRSTAGQGHDSTRQDTTQTQSHKGRDAAAIGAAGAAGAGATHEYSKHEAEKAEKERMKELEKEQKHHTKEVEKEHERNQKLLEKEHEKQAKEHEKYVKEHEKKAHKGGLLGFLHKDKKDQPHPDQTFPEHQHKDADPTHPDPAHPHQHVGIAGHVAGEGPSYTPEHKRYDDEMTALGGGAGAGALAGEHHERNRLHKDPPAGYAGTGTGDHVGIDGPIGDPSRASGADHGHAGQQEGVVIEPHTGLPMNIGKYGTTGAGGVDGNSNIEGFHDHSNLGVPAAETGRSGSVTNWEEVRKANTPY